MDTVINSFVEKSKEILQDNLVGIYLHGYGHLDDDTPSFAISLYKNVGFKIVDENDEEYIMVCEL